MPDCPESTLKIVTELSGLIISIATFVTGAILFFRGYREYKISNKVKRAEFLERLITMFNEPELKPAKDILEDFVYPDSVRIAEMSEEQYRVHASVNLIKTLRNHHDEDVTNPIELEVRKSFSDLLDFFSKLSYYLDNELITAKELGYFKYYLEKIDYNVKKSVNSSDPKGTREAIKRENLKKLAAKKFIETYFYPEDFERLFNALAKTTITSLIQP
jgi:hypothetical protein